MHASYGTFNVSDSIKNLNNYFVCYFLIQTRSKF